MAVLPVKLLAVAVAVADLHSIIKRQYEETVCGRGNGVKTGAGCVVHM